TTPNCITLLPETGANSSATLDPLHIGPDQALLSFLQQRYPHANDLTQGDGINTGGFRFHASAPLTENIYTTRIDYNFSAKHKFFTRFNFNNEDAADDINTGDFVNGVAASVVFPGDPISAKIVTRDKAWVLGWTWTPTQNTVNQFVYGESRNELSFNVPFN